MEALRRLSLEELTQVRVSIANHYPQAVADTAAAVFVLTNDYIRRSGATSIPEALRLVPGLQVARIDGNKWAISARGFNDQFANKLLVLMDGRTLYNNLFSGVFWDVQDTLLQDIERIEVVRGPGASVWGSNAVNGVINIVTKHAGDTQGGLAAVGGGDYEKGFVGGRYGRQSDSGAWRIYAKAFERDNADGGNDAWRMLRAGFRGDWENGNDHFTLQGDLYDGTENTRTQPKQKDIMPPFFQIEDTETKASGANLLFHWRRQQGPDDEWALRAYLDHTERSEFFLAKDERDVFDLELRKRMTRGDHEWVLGGGFRYLRDETDAGRVGRLLPDQRSDTVFSLFIQDEIYLDDDLQLSLGLRLENNEYTDFEYQPSVRLLWHPGEQQTLWAAVSRAMRTPSRFEQDMQLMRGRLGETDVVLGIEGSRDMLSEELIAYEAGYRSRPHPDLYVDFAAFYFDYDKLRSLEIDPLVTNWQAAPGQAILPLRVNNQLYGYSYGAELFGSWQASDDWRLSMAYSYLDMSLQKRPGSTDLSEQQDENDNPQHQLRLTSSWDIGPDWELDASLRHVSEIQRNDGLERNIDPYTVMDLRLGWRPYPMFELALVGRDLFHGPHREFTSSTFSIQATEVSPSVYLQAQWRIE